MNDSIEDAFRHANRLLEQQQAEAAEPLLWQIIARAPQHHGAWHGLGIVAFHRGNLTQATERVLKAIQINRQVGLYHRNLAELFRLQGKTAQAITAGRNATTLMPDDATAFYNLALALAGNGQHEEAIAAYKTATRLKPGHAMALNNLGNLYSELGLLDDARQCFAEAIHHKHDNTDAHYNLSALKTYTLDDTDYPLLQALGENPNDLTPAAQVNLYFALGKAHEDCRNPAAAFAAYEKGNRLYRQLNAYDEAADIRNERAIRNTFTPEFIEQHQGLGHAGEGAIFIIGMPRSGTTLVEQILSSHDAIRGAGEISALSDVMDEWSGPGRLFYPQQLQPGDWETLGQRYLQKLECYRHNPQVTWVSNKTPNNFLFLGLVKLMLPGAKIIHVLRDPMDSCFSCYARLFSSPVPFSYDLYELGRYYVRYRELMNYWERLMPPGSIHTVAYEKLVQDFEPQVRALLGYIGVEWQEQCLQFQENRRKVSTASIAQVRKPLYTTSVARWEHFSPHLQPLMEIVRDYR